MKSNSVSIRRMRWMLFLLGIFKIPLLAFTKPRLISVSDEEVRVRIRLRRRTKNHLNSMYFGALAVGADVAGGIHAFYFSEKIGKKVSFAFKSMQAEFLKRAESDVTFVCTSGKIIQAAVEESFTKKERINQQVEVLAFNTTDEIVARFVLEISVRV
jgi:acyl-coenzyme A thioesterase PaaI-like protein